MTDNSTINKNDQIKQKRIIVRKGRWSIEEQSRFNEGLEIYGRNWKKIQLYVKTRSLLQIRSHAQKYFMMQQKIGKIKKKSRKIITKEEMRESNQQNENFEDKQIDNSNEHSELLQSPIFLNKQNNQILKPTYQYSMASITPQPLNFGTQNIYPNIQYNINMLNQYPEPSFSYPQPQTYFFIPNAPNYIQTPIMNTSFFLSNK